jgi:uncharacterized protein (DUF934 family)
VDSVEQEAAYKASIRSISMLIDRATFFVRAQVNSHAITNTTCTALLHFTTML